MALTSINDGKILNVTHDATADWIWKDATHGWSGFEDGIYVDMIMWFPNTDDDEIIIRNNDSAGPIIFKCKASNDTDQRVAYFNGMKLKPCAYGADLTGADQILGIIIK